MARSAAANEVALDTEALAATVLQEEGRRQEEQQKRAAQQEPQPDAPLAGVGGEAVPFREVIAGGRLLPLLLMGLLPFIDSLGGASFSVLGPDIRRSLDLSLTQLGVVGSLGGLLVLLLTVPFGAVADRHRRWPVLGGAALVLGVFTFFTGLVQSAWQLVVTSTISGVGRAVDGPVQGSLVGDLFPIQGRNRVFAVIRGAGALGAVVGPVTMGAIATQAGGPNGWRWAFYVTAIPALALGVIAFFQKEPRRGVVDMRAILGEELPGDEERLHIPLSAGFARLKKIRTFNYVIIAVAVVGLTLIAVPIFTGVLLEERYGLDASGRGVVGSFAAVGGMVGVALAGTYGDRQFAKSPVRAMRISGLIVALAGVAGAVAVFMPNAVLYTIFASIGSGATFGGFVTLQGGVTAVTPYRLRGTSQALVFLYLALFGGLVGSILVAILTNQTSVTVGIAISTALAGGAGGAVLAYGARFVPGDMARASADMLEERDELRRVAAGHEVPLLQVRNLDFSYGPVQVLFDVSIDVWEGEVVALLGTNGAGKSTLLRAVSGLSYVDRGVVRMSGRTVTFDEPGTRLRHGIVQVPGGKATFPNLSVLDNLRATGFSVRGKELEDRISRVLDTFPALAGRLEQAAGTLSGGEQQQLAIAGALLLEPKLLLIDELSLGLSPIIVQQLLEVVERLKADGLTMVIVEQSVNIALALADRAIFMEKGRVRFEGAAEELLERDDLVRAVFLGGEGG